MKTPLRVLFVAALLLGGCEQIQALLSKSDGPAAESGESAGAATGQEEAQAQDLTPAEQEPNDTQEEANRLTPGEALAGELTAGDVDFFQLSGGSEAIDLEFQGSEGIAVELFRPQDAASVHYQIGRNGLYLGGLSREATLYFRLSGEGEYRISSSAAAEVNPCGLHRESDDIGRPGMVFSAVPAQGSGCISSPDDLDFFLIPAAILADQEGVSVALTGVPDVALEMRIKDDTGRVLVSTYGEPGQDIAIPNVGRPASGDLVVELRSRQGASERQPYRLSLRRLPPLTGTIEFEPNDDPANPFVLREIGLVAGYLHRPGDVDHYVLETATTSLVKLVAEPPEGVDLRIRLEREGESALTIDQARAGSAEQICSIYTGPGVPFQFQVSAEGSQVATREPYHLRFELLEGTNWELEPNDNLEQALAAVSNKIGASVGFWSRDGQGEEVWGYTFPVGDTDLHVLDIPADPAAGATYHSITIRLEPNGAVDYQLELLDEDRAMVGRADNGLAGESESLSLDLPAGRYFARVSYLSGDACARPYRLQVAKTGFPDEALEDEGEEEADDEEEEEEAEEEDVAEEAVVPRLPSTEVAPRLNRPAPRLDRPVHTPEIQDDRAVQPLGGGGREWRPPARNPGQQPPTFGGGTGR